jgi:acyl carrier protein
MIDRLQALQSETLKAHSQFMANDSEYTHLFGQLTQQELSLLANSPSQAALEQINTALQTLDRSMAQFHQHQSETLRVHEQYLRSQSELINSLVQLSQAPGGQGVFIPPAPAAAALSVVKPVAAAPVAVTTPLVQAAEMEKVTSDLIGGLGATAPANVIPNVITKETPVGVGSISLESITQGLLGIVSEKTGYPSEMLELGMDMEADLGIDSIKRVEIMGAMQARFPELPKADATALAEMRTLGQIVEYMAASAPGTETTDSIEGLRAVVTTNDNRNGITNEASSAAVKEPGLPRGLVKLKALPEPDHLDAKLAEGHICLLMDDGTALTPAVANMLAGQGHKVVVLSLPVALVSSKMPLPDNIERVQLDDLSEAGLQQSLAAVQQANGPAAVYIHLDPPASSRGAFSEAEKTIVKTAFLAAKYLKETLTNAAQNGYAAFMAVTRLDGEFGLADSGAVEPVSGGLFGLVKTLNLEWDKVFCRAIDLQPAIDNQSAARHIAAELYDPNRLISEVSYNLQGRFTLVVEQPLVEA